MSIFDTPISALTQSDLNELLAERAVENVRLEFKKLAPERDECLKKLSSFANTFGGYLVVGAEADSKDSRLKALPGVPPIPNYKATINQWAFAGVSPPFYHLEVSDAIPVGIEDRVCYVIFVRESDLAPHFLNGRLGLYVRTDEISSRFEARLANESELRALLNRRELVRKRRLHLVERARSRFDSYTERSYRDYCEREGRSSDRMGAHFEIGISPRFPAFPIAEHAELFEYVRRDRLQWRGTTFPRTSENTVSQHESAIFLTAGESFSLLEANVWGLIFFAAELQEEFRSPSGLHPGIHFWQFLGQTLAVTRYTGEVLGHFGYRGPLHVHVEMRKVRSVPWIHSERALLTSTGPCSVLDDIISFEFDTDSEAIRDSSDNVALRIFREAVLATNWDQSMASPQKLGELLKKAYEYNWWQWPS